MAALGACSTYDQTAGGGAPPAPKDSAGAGAGSGDGALVALASTADIPVGSGVIFEKDGVVVTQPQAGTFKAFNTVCTHAGCAVGEVKNGTINCPCHGSAFKIADGSVARGPAGRPLKAVNIAVEGNDIRLT
jgi:Rieske Fe-S protein